MNDSMIPQEPTLKPIRDNSPSNDDAPQFGALDIVEAFTAMRHEWRGQTKESRELSEQVQSAVANLRTLESKLLAWAADNRPDDSSEAKQLALLVVETDHQVTRAVTAIAQWETNRRLREDMSTDAAERYYAGMSRLARWFARPLLEFITAQRPKAELAAEHPAIEGLNLVLGRLRRAMYELGIERVDVLGQPFDASTMHAIGTVASVDCPSAHVAEQLSPAYLWQGRLLRFADVRVAT